MEFIIDERGVIEQPQAIALFLEQFSGVGGVRNVTVPAVYDDDPSISIVFEAQYFPLNPQTIHKNELYLGNWVLGIFGMRLQFRGNRMAPCSISPKWFSERSGGELNVVRIDFGVEQTSPDLMLSDDLAEAARLLRLHETYKENRRLALAMGDSARAVAFGEAADLVVAAYDAMNSGA